jgi:hypothetical protein
MQDIATSTRLNTLQKGVLECIVYSDLFDFPQTPSEVHRWLSVPATLEDVTAALHSEPLASMLTHAGSYVTLRGREPNVALRVHRRESSALLRRKAERYGRLIARLPFVRMVAITGSLAMDNADEEDDLDYLIVTAHGRVWLTRTMIMAIGRFASLQGVTLCPNYLLAETALALRDHDFYTARELLQMQVVAGEAAYAGMLEANGWWRTFLPNAETPPPSPLPAGGEGESYSVRPEPVEGRGRANNLPSSAGFRKRLFPRRALEWVLGFPPFDLLERWVYTRKAAELRRTAGGPEAVYDETMCKGHFDAWKARTRRRMAERMRQLTESKP